MTEQMRRRWEWWPMTIFCGDQPYIIPLIYYSGTWSFLKRVSKKKMSGIITHTVQAFRAFTLRILLSPRIQESSEPLITNSNVNVRSEDPTRSLTSKDWDWHIPFMIGREIIHSSRSSNCFSNENVSWSERNYRETQGFTRTFIRSETPSIWSKDQLEADLLLFLFLLGLSSNLWIYFIFINIPGYLPWSTDIYWSKLNYSLPYPWSGLKSALTNTMIITYHCIVSLGFPCKLTTTATCLSLYFYTCFLLDSTWISHLKVHLMNTDLSDYMEEVMLRILLILSTLHLIPADVPFISTWS